MKHRRISTSAADQRLMICNSYERPHQLWMEMLRERTARGRIALFLEWWNVCDAPWAYRGVFTKLLREALKEVALRGMLPKDDRDWFDGLPELIPIYRGGDIARERGLSWTTDENVARGFARGKRCINTFPTLLSAVIPKRHVFAVISGRNEHEIVVDYRRLRQLKELPCESLRAAVYRQMLEADLPPDNPVLVAYAGRAKRDPLFRLALLATGGG
jgi:hypothetical protein